MATSLTKTRAFASSVFLLLVLLQFPCLSYAFAPAPFQQPPSTTTTISSTATSSATALHCICVDCKWVTSCAAYNFVESKHQQPHMTEDPTFEPRDGSPTIHVNIRSIRTKEERESEIQRMWSEHAAETKLAEEAAAEAAQMAQNDGDNDNGNNNNNDDLHGEQVYDFSPMTTYEYDVVECADFIEDKGCWVRNMPEEIRKANPDFVPS